MGGFPSHWPQRAGPCTQGQMESKDERALHRGSNFLRHYYCIRMDNESGHLCFNLRATLGNAQGLLVSLCQRSFLGGAYIWCQVLNGGGPHSREMP